MRAEKLQAGEVYHIYNRGVNRGDIFFSPENWAFFLRRWQRLCTGDQGETLAYCLMPNHYHLLVRVFTPDFGLRVMHPFTVSYTKAVNKQMGRVGPLFQGPFQAKRVETDEGLMHLSRYIHRNPVEAGLARSPEDWAYSSYRDYIGLRAGRMVHPAAILSYFGCQEDYSKFVHSEVDNQIIRKVLFGE